MFRITGPGLYKTRAGDKVHIMYPHSHPDSFYKWVGANGSYSDYGRYFESHEHPHDLISFWDEVQIPHNKALLLIERKHAV